MGKCSFCGMEKKPLISGQTKSVNICLDCANKIAKAQKVVENKVNFSKQLKERTILKPHEIVAELDKYIIGQDEAKRIIAVEVYNHFKRIVNKTDVEIKKNNILIIGPTGSGKTEMVNRLAKILNIPVVIEDATGLTASGYVGLNVEHCLSRLYIEANENIELAQKGIIYIDEIDKIASHNVGNTKDVGGESVQQSFLKMIEGSKVSVEISKDKSVEIDTKDILFIFGGAFDGIDEIIKKDIGGSQKVGFGSNISTSDMSEDELLSKVTPYNIKEYGFINEFIGRVPVIATLHKLTKEDLKNILLNTKNSIVDEYKYLFKLDGIDLEFSDSAIDYIVEEALAKCTGARGLRSVFSKKLNELTYELIKNPVNKYEVTEKTFSNTPEILTTELKKQETKKENKKQLAAKSC